MNLNLGCGTKFLPNYINVDMGIFHFADGTKLEPDVICNLNDGIPFEDNNVDNINCDNVIEHLHSKKKENYVLLLLISNVILVIIVQTTYIISENLQYIISYQLVLLSNPTRYIISFYHCHVNGLFLLGIFRTVQQRSISR